MKHGHTSRITGATFFEIAVFQKGKRHSRILAGVCAVAMATELGKNKAFKMFFVCLNKIQSLDCFHPSPTTN